jgi:hypothetical protein
MRREGRRLHALFGALVVASSLDFLVPLEAGLCSCTCLSPTHHAFTIRMYFTTCMCIPCERKRPSRSSRRGMHQRWRGGRLQPASVRGPVRFSVHCPCVSCCFIPLRICPFLRAALVPACRLLGPIAQPFHAAQYCAREPNSEPAAARR